jgi:type VII secretion integral membrane protein EccD
MDAVGGGSVPAPPEELPTRGLPGRRYGDPVPESRVCIRSDGGAEPAALDVVLPSGIPVEELVPAIVDLIGGAASGAPKRWRLDRPVGERLEESLSLCDNGVRDGDLLILHSAEAPRLGAVRVEPWHLAVEARQQPSQVGRYLPDALCMLTTILAAAALAWTVGSEHATMGAIIAAVGAVAASAVAVSTGFGTAACVAVVSASCATGFLAVPSGPAAPNVFLAATAAFSAALLMSRLSGRVSPTLVAIAALSLPTAMVTVVAIPAAATGAALSTAALVLLALAPRTSALTAGLVVDAGRRDEAKHATVAHATLSGLVGGCAAGGAAGTVAVVAANPVGTAAGVTFIALIGAALLLRARTYVDPSRRIALITGGLASIGAGVVFLCSTRQDFAGPVAAILIAVGLVATRRPTIGAALARMLDRLECAVLAAVVPVSCWVAGTHELLEGLHVP